VDYHSHVDGAGYRDWWHNREQVVEEGYTTDLITQHAVEFIKKHQDEPFCLYVAHEAPHFPFQGRHDPPDRLPGGKFPAHGSRKDSKNAYKEMIMALDESVGQVISIVKELGIEKDTFIFFCSDNGAILKVGSNGNLRGAKGSLWEGGHRVPAIAYWPGKIKSGSVCEETVLSMDLFPTMVSIAGIKPPSNLKFDGVDISPLLFKNQKLPERTLFWRYRKHKVARRGPWKLLIEDSKKFLFNLEKDISEKVNLADEHPEIVAQLEKQLSEWEVEVSKGVKFLTR